MPLHQQKFLVVSGLSNSPIGCREIWKVDQNKVTKHFSVGNTFRRATMQAQIFCICCAITWIRPMVKSRPNMNKIAIILRPLMELVHYSLSTDWKKNLVPVIEDFSYRLDIIATGKLISSPTTAQFLTKEIFLTLCRKVLKSFQW